VEGAAAAPSTNDIRYEKIVSIVQDSETEQNEKAGERTHSTGYVASTKKLTERKKEKRQ